MLLTSIGLTTKHAVCRKTFMLKPIFYMSIITDCGELSPPTHGTIQYTDETVYQSVASYSCDIGYSVEGRSTRICQADASWSHTEPTCVIKGEFIYYSFRCS